MKTFEYRLYLVLLGILGIKFYLIETVTALPLYSMTSTALTPKFHLLLKISPSTHWLILWYLSLNLTIWMNILVFC